MELRPFIISSLILGLLALAMINAGIILASNNGATESISNDSIIRNYASNLSEELEDSSSVGSSAKESFSNSTVSVSGGVVFVEAIGGLWKSLTAVPVTIINLTVELIKGRILGDTAFYAVFGVITLASIITIIFAVWKLVSTGEGG